MHRVRIGIENEDGTLKTIYCSADGYLPEMGQYLINNWNSEQRARMIVDGGPISYLGQFFDKEEADSHYQEFIKKCHKANIDTNHVEEFANIRTVLRNAKEYGEEIWESMESFLDHDCFKFPFGLYLYKEGKWFWIGQGYDNSNIIALPPIELSKAVEEALESEIENE